MIAAARTPTTLRALLVMGLFVLSAPLLSACNTMAGLGQDTQSAGRALTETSRDVQQSPRTP